MPIPTPIFPQQPDPWCINAVSDCLTVCIYPNGYDVTQCEQAVVEVCFNGSTIPVSFTLCNVEFSALYSGVPVTNPCTEFNLEATPAQTNTNFYNTIRNNHIFSGVQITAPSPTCTRLTWRECKHQPCLAPPNTDLTNLLAIAVVTIDEGADLTLAPPNARYAWQLFELPLSGDITAELPVSVMSEPLPLNIYNGQLLCTPFDIENRITPLLGVTLFDDNLPCTYSAYNIGLLKNFYIKAAIYTNDEDDCTPSVGCLGRTLPFKVADLRFQYWHSLGIEDLCMTHPDNPDGQTSYLTSMPSGFRLCRNSDYFIFAISQHNALFGIPYNATAFGVTTRLSFVYDPFFILYDIMPATPPASSGNYDGDYVWNASPRCWSQYLLNPNFHTVDIVGHINDALAPALGTQIIRKHSFKVMDCCCMYELYFKNSWGGFDTVPLDCISEISVSTSFDEYCKSVCRKQEGGQLLPMRKYKKVTGSEVFNKQAVEVMRFKTMPQNVAGTDLYYLDMLASTEVYIRRLIDYQALFTLKAIIVGGSYTTYSTDNKEYIMEFDLRMAEQIKTN